jgi:hypothetical protein
MRGYMPAQGKSGPGKDMFDRAREVADALGEAPEVTATEYKASGKSVRVLFAVEDRNVGDLLRRILEKFRMTADLPGGSFRIGIYDADDRNIILVLDIDGEHAGSARDALRAIGRC